MAIFTQLFLGTVIHRGHLYFKYPDFIIYKLNSTRTDNSKVFDDRDMNF